MKVRGEIEKNSKPEHREALLWLFGKYHMESQWRFVAKAVIEKLGAEYDNVRRSWVPTEEGMTLYNHYMENKP